MDTQVGQTSNIDTMKTTSYILLLAACIPSLSFAAAETPPCVPYFSMFTDQRETPNTSLKQKQGKYALHAYFWCSNEVGISKSYGVVCSTEVNSCTAAMVSAGIQAFLDAVDKKSHYKAVWAANVEYDCDVPEVTNLTTWPGRMCREHNRIFKANKAQWEAGIIAPEWRIKAHPTTPDRPYYKTDDMNHLLGRVATGKLCDPTKYFKMTGKDAWMTWDATGYVTLCTRIK